MHLLAALIFFTRLPWWRLKEVPKEAFEHVVDWWPQIGWLTGGLMAAVYAAGVLLGLSAEVSALLAIASRMLLTGALHEDGLADCCDGFGGGTSRARTLSIMKDSHIGSYGVLGLLLYVVLLWAVLVQLSGVVSRVAGGAADFVLASFAVFILADVAGKAAASLITGQLPYARGEGEAKNGVVYAGRTVRAWLFHLLRCCFALSLPVALCVSLGLWRATLVLPVPFVAEWLLMRFMRRRLGGYTGDCCGLLFLASELAFYISLALLLQQ